jgi:hypothetical protein
LIFSLLLLRTGAAVSAGLGCEESKKAYQLNMLYDQNVFKLGLLWSSPKNL